ncbi:hypothetical protein BGZ73_008157 [Actinomortierella ambigua]|nr:hypothetical protein BGZ73_008157 [Actinomortierella ambigua]
MLKTFPPSRSGVNPLELIDVVERIIPFLDYDTLVTVRTVSRLWYQLTQKQLVPQTVVHWNEFLPEEKLAAIADNLDKTRVLTIDTKFYPGKALWSFPQRDARKVAYATLTKAMSDPAKNKRLEEIVFKGGMLANEDLFPVLPNMAHLERLTIEPHPEIGYADREGLLKLLGQTNPGGPGESLRELTMRHGRWHSTMSASKPCRLRKLVLDQVDMMDNNVMGVLHCCPELEELVAIRTLARWAIPQMSALSKSCPKLKRLTFENKVAWNTAQMGWMTRFLVPEIEALTIHGYDGSVLEEMLVLLGERFKQLEKLELRQCQGTCAPVEVGIKLIKFLSELSPRLQHLCVPDAEWSLVHMKEIACLLASRDLHTLEIGFSHTGVGSEMKDVVEFLADQWPKLRYLTLTRVNLREPAQDLRALKKLKDLVRVKLVVDELGPLVGCKDELKTFVFGKPGVWPLLNHFEIVYQSSQEDAASIQALGEWLQQEARPLVTFSLDQCSK